MFKKNDVLKGAILNRKSINSYDKNLIIRTIMKILLIGNIASGKTTLGKKIQEQTGYKFVQIDELRERYLKNKVSEEYYSLFQFLKHIENTKNIILEFTGVGCHKFAVKRALELSNDRCLIVLCKVRDIATIRERLKLKKYRYKIIFDVDINEHINFIENEIKKDLAENFWESEHFRFTEVKMDTLDDLKSNLSLIIKELSQMN